MTTVSTNLSSSSWVEPDLRLPPTPRQKGKYRRKDEPLRSRLLLLDPWRGEWMVGRWVGRWMGWMGG